MRSGPKAILYRGALFRVSELVWVKSAPLTPVRLALKLLLIAGGALFFLTVGWAKGDDWNGFKNLEGIMGLLALHIGFRMQGDVRLASSGDVADSYEDRGGDGERRTFSQWIAALVESEDECKLGNASSPYYYWINLRRVAWARPCLTFELYPLLAVPVFLGYAWVIRQNFKFDFSGPVISDLNLLAFPNGSGTVVLISYLLALAGVAACVTSFAKAVDVRACGGVQDRFRMSGRDQARFLDALAGHNGASAAKPVAAAPAPVSAVAPTRTAPAPAPPAPARAEEPQQETTPVP